MNKECFNHESYFDYERELTKQKIDTFYIPRVRIEDWEEHCRCCDGRGINVETILDRYPAHSPFDEFSSLYKQKRNGSVTICCECMSLGKKDWISNILGFTGDWFNSCKDRIEQLLRDNIHQKVGSFFDKKKIEDYLSRLYSDNILQTFVVDVDFRRDYQFDKDRVVYHALSRIQASIYAQRYKRDREPWTEHETYGFPINISYHLVFREEEIPHFIETEGANNEVARAFFKIYSR